MPFTKSSPFWILPLQIVRQINNHICAPTGGLKL